MNDNGLNQKSWEILFERYKILEKIERDGVFYITSKQIKDEREPRLMAKFDHTIQLPPIFSDNGLAILPVTRRDYAIAHFDAYHSFEPISKEITRVSMPNYIESVDVNNIPSEAVALNCAISTGIIADFTGDFDIIPTVSGRMGSGNFDFNIRDTKTSKLLTLGVNNSQIEIDAAYEGVNYLSLLEAKRDISADFLVRQLYYPYRVWQSRVTKPVKPIFLVYSNGIYNLYEYKFVNPNEYGSLQIVKQKNYSLEDTEINIEDILNILKNIKIESEPQDGIPFPQADSFARVINLCELLSEGDYDKDKITQNYDFDGRQTNYYVAAGTYLGFIEKKKDKGYYQLSALGKKLLKMNYKQRQLVCVERILSHKAFYDVANIYFNRGEMPEKNKIVEIMHNCNLQGIKADETYNRRASTISGWIGWIASLI